MKKFMYSSVPLGDGIVYVSGFVIFLSIIILLFTGCKTTEPKARDYFTKHPDKFADLAGQYFAPVTTYVTGESILTPGDTVLIPGDSIPCPEQKQGEKQPVKIKCPESKIIHATLHQVDTFFVENTAKVQALSLEIKRMNTDNGQIIAANDDLKHQRWYIFLFGLLSPFITYGLFKVASRLFL